MKELVSLVLLAFLGAELVGDCQRLRLLVDGKVGEINDHLVLVVADSASQL